TYCILLCQAIVVLGTNIPLTMEEHDILLMAIVGGQQNYVNTCYESFLVFSLAYRTIWSF
ncbi:MAG TPA: hypothetical protein VFY68_17770, partial [Nitrososphaeraceae archaeon]|nr:hypothetical protein [Nitrososphaeraceae archaeon]